MPDGIILRTSAVCVTVVMQSLRLDAWEHAKCICWKMVTGINESSATTLIQVGWARGSRWYPFRGGAAAAAGISISLFGDVCLPGEFVPEVRFFGATLGDTLVLTACGELEPD